MIYSLVTLPTSTDLFAGIGNWSSGMFDNLFSIGIAIAGFIIGGLLIAFLVQGVILAFDKLLDRVTHKKDDI